MNPDRRRANIAPRFWAKVEKTDLCWLWTGRVGDHGYGEFHLDGRTTTAHRVAWELVHGAITDGLHIDHLCRNRRCVNPNHLEVVTPAENARRGEQATKLHCSHGHLLDGRNNRGARYCKTCVRLHARRRGIKNMTPNMKQALAMLTAAAEQGQDPHGVLMATSRGSGERTALIDGQPWIHYTTAYALEKRGLVTVEECDEAGIYLRVERWMAGRERIGA